MAIEELISREKIQARIKELGCQISDDYRHQELVIVCVLKGAFMFCADLVREIDIAVEVDFMTVSSYGDKQESSGTLSVLMDLDRELKGKHVLIIEDIVDTGLTISFLMSNMKKKNPSSVKLAALLFKPARLKHDIKVDYLAFEIEDKFIVGYGLDYAGKFRQLPFVGVYSDDN